MRKNLKTILILVSLVAIAFGVVSAILMLTTGRAGFPILSAGNYIGTIDGLGKQEDGKPTKLFIQVTDDEPARAFVAVLANGWKSQLIVYKKEFGDLHPPLVLVGPNSKYTLMGERSGNLSFEGTIEDGASGVSGTWRLVSLGEYPALETPGELQQLRALIVAKARVREINEQIKTSEMTVSQQKEEITKLQHYITEGESLKRNADKKYKEAHQILKTVQAEVESLKKEADGLVQKLELSQRLTGMGKLVLLARKSAERENRWIDSMLRTSVSDVSLELDSQVERGERILVIKNQIAEEHDKVFRLLQVQGRTGEQP